MDEIVRTAFKDTVQFLPSELALMPLDRWNEAVLRYHFCRFLARSYPQVKQLVECDRIDLVLHEPPLIAFIEFKLYWHPHRFDPYNREARGLKGGPSLKNLREFQACINHLHERPLVPHLSKYVVLVYADPPDESRPNCRFSRHYDNYRHPGDLVSLRRIECSSPIQTGEAIIRAQLYEIA